MFDFLYTLYKLQAAEYGDSDYKSNDMKCIHANRRLEEIQCCWIHDDGVQ